MGYNRFDQHEWTETLNDIYTSEWRVIMNFFRPSSKLLSKERVGAKVKKHYDVPKTPLQRVLQSDEIPLYIKEQLTIKYESMNPFKLQKGMEIKIKRFLNKTQPLYANYSITNVK